MLEVEVKYRVNDTAAVEARLVELGGQAPLVRDECDHYFNAPDRDFAQTDEALRLRRIGDANFVTYKGPKLDAQTKTRAEIEVPLADGEQAAHDFMRILEKLGYRPVAVVRKRRRIYHFDSDGFALEVCLDQVHDLGSFVELEIQAAPERLDKARQVVLAWAAKLGLGEVERRAYLQLLLIRQSESKT